MNLKRSLLAFTGLTMLVVALAGCSQNNPMDALVTESGTGSTSKQMTSPGPVQFAARVKTTDQSRLMLTFVGQSDTAFALQNCQIVRLKGSTEAPIPFSDIQPGDSLGIRGNRMQNGYVYANKIEFCASAGSGGYDLAFRDTIVSIDYSAGTFVVRNHLQIIRVNSETEIWGVIGKQKFGPADPHLDPTGDDSRGNNFAGKLNPGAGGYQVSHDTSLVFTDLQIGNVVEVRADIIDENTLLARKIKLANCPEKLCVTFEAYLSSVGVSASVVTFEQLPWIGLLCNGVKLTDLDGSPLTLADFSIGDYVAVKGFPVVGDTLKICQMERTVAP